MSGAKTAVSTAQASTQPAAPAAPVPDVRPHTAVVRWITGLTSTKARSQPDMICGPTKMLPAKVSGIKIIMDMPLTELVYAGSGGG